MWVKHCASVKQNFLDVRESVRLYWVIILDQCCNEEKERDVVVQSKVA